MSKVPLGPLLDTDPAVLRLRHLDALLREQHGRRPWRLTALSSTSSAHSRWNLDHAQGALASPVTTGFRPDTSASARRSAESRRIPARVEAGVGLVLAGEIPAGHERAIRRVGAGVAACRTRARFPAVSLAGREQRDGAAPNGRAPTPISRHFGAEVTRTTLAFHYEPLLDEARATRAGVEHEDGRPPRSGAFSLGLARLHQRNA